MEKVIDFDNVNKKKLVTTKEAVVNTTGEVITPAITEEKLVPMVILTLSSGKEIWRTKKEVDRVLAKYGVNSVAFLIRAEVPIIEYYQENDDLVNGKCRKSDVILKKVKFTPSEKMLSRVNMGNSAITVDDNIE